MSRALQLAQTCKDPQGKITPQCLAIYANRLWGRPPVRRRLRAPVDEVEQNPTALPGQNRRQIGKNAQVSVNPACKHGAQQNRGPMPGMGTVGPQQIIVVLTIQNPRLGIMDDIEPSTGHRLIHPPIMKRDASIQRERQGIGQKFGHIRGQHNRIATQDILHQRISKPEGALIIRRHANRVQGRICIDASAGIDLRPRPAPNHIDGTRQFMGHPHVILIGECNPRPRQFRARQQRHEILRTPPTRPRYQPNIAIRMRDDKPVHTSQRIISRPVIADPKGPVAMGLSKNGLQLRPNIGPAIFGAQQDMNMWRMQNPEPLTATNNVPPESTDRLTIGDRV